MFYSSIMASMANPRLIAFVLILALVALVALLVVAALVLPGAHQAVRHILADGSIPNIIVHNH